VGPEQRERLLEAVVSKVDDDGQPYPLTGSELKLLVDRMLDPATPTAELNRLLNDPRARPKPPSGSAAVEGNGHAAEPFVSEDSDTRPWEREWESPLKGGDGEAFDRVRSVDEEIERSGGAAREQQIADLLGRAEGNAAERAAQASGTLVGERDFRAGLGDETRMREGVYAASRALEDLAPQVMPEDVRRQVEAVVALLQNLLG
jgi:hypothetical protein